MKTLIYTSIYNDLFGTEYGGRSSRKIHYNYSLLNILNLKADKFVCFTQKSDLEDLKAWFYNENNVSEDLLEFIVFELKDTKYHDKIRRLKDIEFVKTSDRCYEVQYNKFYLLNKINDLDEYQKVYWFDAGISYSGLFPEKYTMSDTYYRYFNFSLFNKNYLNHLNTTTDNSKLIVVGKNNTDYLFWSHTLPEKYFTNYNNTIHIIGGFFGGNASNMQEYCRIFNNYLNTLLDREDRLYYEEHIMTVIYQNHESMFNLFFFDDWYDNKREQYLPTTKFFYNLFEI